MADDLEATPDERAAEALVPMVMPEVAEVKEAAMAPELGSVLDGASKMRNSMDIKLGIECHGGVVWWITWRHRYVGIGE